MLCWTKSPDVHGAHKTGAGGGSALGERVGLGAGGDVGGDAAQRCGDIRKASRTLRQTVDRVESHLILDVSLPPHMVVVGEVLSQRRGARPAYQRG